MDNIFLSHAPFIRSKNDTNRMFLYVAFALIIPAVFGCMFFGIRALGIIAISVATCFLSECLYNFINKKKFFVDDFSFFVTSLILALLMPVRVPFYVVIICGFISIFIVKMAFGGLGRNDLNPALVGRGFAGMIVPAMASELYNITSGAETLRPIIAGGEYTLQEIMSGRYAGGIGTTCMVLLLACFVFLVLARVIDFKIPLISVLSFVIVGIVIWGLEGAIANLCSCSFLFLCIFVLTDPNTSPDTLLAKFICSALFGALAPLIMRAGVLGENSLIFLALLVNILSPILNKLFSWRPIQMGGIRNAHKN